MVEKKATSELEDKYEPLKPYQIDDEERATINDLIDKVEGYRKDGNFNYDENYVKETPENFKYRTTRQSLINFYGQMLKEQLAGSDKWNPCIQKYQDVFPVNGFIVAVKMSKQGVDGINYKFGTHQSKLHNVYTEMRGLESMGSYKWDTCIEAYKDAFPVSAKKYAITTETVFYLNNNG